MSQCRHPFYRLHKPKSLFFKPEQYPIHVFRPYECTPECSGHYQFLVSLRARKNMVQERSRVRPDISNGRSGTSNNALCRKAQSQFYVLTIIMYKISIGGEAQNSLFVRIKIVKRRHKSVAYINRFSRFRFTN